MFLKPKISSDFIFKQDHMMICVWFLHKNMKCFFPAMHDSRVLYFGFELLQNSALYLITSPQERPRL